jgi:hypothetical protein
LVVHSTVSHAPYLCGFDFFAGKTACGPKAFVVYAWLLIATAITFFFVVSLVPQYVDEKLETGIKEGILITPEAQAANNFAYRTWQSSFDAEATPTTMSIMMWNLTNAAEVLEGARPNLVEVGPYVYQEHSVKYNVTFVKSPSNGLNTVEFLEWKYYIFDRAATPAALAESDLITTQNTVFQIWRPMANAALVDSTFVRLWNDTNDIGDEMNDLKRMFTTRPVSELLWGYHDPRFGLPSLTADEQVAEPLFHEAGLTADGFFPGFLGPNSTKEEVLADAAGWRGFYTGDDSIASAFAWSKYNNASHVQSKSILGGGKYNPVWDSPEASMIIGTDGRHFTPFNWVTKDSELPVYVSDAHRSVMVTCTGERKVHGAVDTLEFTLSPRDMQNATVEPRNAAWHMYGPSGFFNLSSFNVAAMVLSKPHFLDVSPVVAEKLDGMHPDRGAHETVLLVEPVSGVVMSASKSLQMSVNTIGPLTVKKLAHKPVWFAALTEDLYIPSVWMNEAGGIAANKAREFADTVYPAQQLAARLRLGGLIAGTAAALLAVVFLTVAFHRANSKRTVDGAFPSINSGDYSSL